MKKRKSDMNGRIAAGVVLILGVAISVGFSIYGFPSIFSKSETQNLEPKTLVSSELVTVDLSSLDLEIADTSPSRKLGLGGRQTLDDNAGMLFVFPSSGRHSFWMKGMQFPIDIIWISDSVVIDIVTLHPPYPGLPIPPSHRPKVAADLVLELNAGKAEELGIKEGVSLSF